ncbi:permease [Marinoscillum sp.]|uniref:permease n=1 Tax=Marinoscillum sp. TaxID=2024838 RepID=UPI003BAAA034
MTFLEKWAEAAYTTTGFFWMALWAFILGYGISSIIQVFVTEDRMKNLMGDSSLKSISIGSFFGFISSSCSFSALATSKTLFQKGASFVASIAFLLASTNLVIELGIVISIFLGWQFILGEYVGGLLLIGFSWLLIALIRPNSLINNARDNLKQLTNSSAGGHHDHGQQHHQHEHSESSLKQKWAMVGHKYQMEWNMVWKDVTIGFTIAGLVAAFVPRSFFETLFINTAQGGDYSFFTLLEHVIIGPVAAFMTFIGSMGNIPLAALLYDNGVSFAGVMAFIFSDLVVLPVLRINAKYYGWKMSLFILLLLFSSLIATSLMLHYGLDFLEMLPTSATNSITEQNHFQWDYTTFMNFGFLILSGILIYLGKTGGHAGHHHEMAPKSPLTEKILKVLALISYGWLSIGLMLKYIIL